MNTKKLDSFVKKCLNDENEWKKLSRGTASFYWCYRNTTENYKIFDKLVIRDVIWFDELEDYDKAFKKYEVKKILFANTGSSCMNNLCWLLEHGWKFDGMDVFDCFGLAKKGIVLVRE